MKLKFAFAALAGAMVLPSAAMADAIISVTPTLSPNVYGSPSDIDWANNAIEALRTGASSYGTGSTPSFYEARDQINAAQGVVTNFYSWMGKADPGSVFGPEFASELGNRITFGVKIDGNGSQFSIDQLGFGMSSTDPFNDFDGVGIAPGGFNYGTDAYGRIYVGLLKGLDDTLFTDDDVYITSGLSSTLVDGLLGSGAGSSYSATCGGCSLADQQAEINAVAGYYPGTTFQINGTYSLGASSTTGTVTVHPVPEPATWAMMIGGFGLAGAAMRRRRAATLSLA